VSTAQPERPATLSHRAHGPYTEGAAGWTAARGKTLGGGMSGAVLSVLWVLLWASGFIAAVVIYRNGAVEARERAVAAQLG